jgi:hypothetical protein
MSGELPVQGTEAAFVTELRTRAQRLHIRIDQTLWEEHGTGGGAELTVVSNGKAYIVSLYPTDLLTCSQAASQKDIVGLILRTIRENRPALQEWERSQEGEPPSTAA